MALTSRYSTIDKAIVVSTGNTLVICGDETEISTNTSEMLKPDGNTTRDYTIAGSSANVNILNNSTILYAELVWLSTVKSVAEGATDVRSIQDNPITFATPKETVNITPEFTDSYTFPNGSVDRLRATNVTDIIKNSLSGTYTISNVPTSIPPSGLSEVRAGWSLTVIYRNDTFKPKRIVYGVGLEAGTTANPIQASFTGFKTESNEDTLKGDIITVFANGNPNDGNDTLKLGPSFANLYVVGNSIGTPNSNPGTAPNNPWNSFSTGQINIADTLSDNKGLIDITGTNGSLNHDAFVPTQVLGARNKWDITCLDISDILVVNQTQLAGQYTISNNETAIELVSFATQIESEAPDIVATLDAYDVDGDSDYNIKLGEEIVYVVQIKNNGKTQANNVTLSTSLNPALQFTPDSVTINGVSKTNANITTGVNIGTIEPSGVTNVSFRVKAIALVEGGTTANTKVDYNYSFISGPNSPTYINYASTNTLNLIIHSGMIDVIKSVSASNANLGDILIYTTEVTNIGSETAINMLFQDKINKYCSFIPGTVKIDGVDKPSFNPNNGFTLSDLLPNTKTTITFSVKVDSLSPNTVIENGALVTFSYIFDQYIVPITKTISSNTTSIQIEFYNIIAKRTANNYYPNVNDTVTYTLNLSNIGNIAALNTEILEPPVVGATFVDGSVYVNEIRQLGYNPFTGFSLDNIDPQTTTTITYEVLINEISPNQIIENIATVPFKYQISAQDPVISKQKDSNIVTTRTNYVTLTIDETVDKSYATIDDILYYSIDITNNGNIDSINTLFSSVIQQESSFIPNTVAINGLIQTDLNPNLGFSIGKINPGNTITVTYQAKVNSLPTPNVIYNNSELVYGYKPDPNGATITESITSNTVESRINIANFNISKSVDKSYAALDEYLVYKCIISNTGTVDLTNVFFSDEISTYVDFVAESVYIDGINYPNYNPNNGFEIGTVKPNENIEILFGVQIKVAPPFGYVVNIGEMTYTYALNPNSPIITESKKSNEVQTKVINGNLSLTKYANLSYATIGDIINYSFEVSNVGNITVNDVFFFDFIPNGTTFVPGSVTVNGISKDEYNPITGFTLDSLNVGQVVLINFSVNVISVPTPNTITNNGSATYSFIINPDMPTVTKTSTSNNVSTVINKASLSLNKSVDKDYATINDELTYTITATNTGTVTLTNVTLKDVIPNGASFVTSSVNIDNINYPNYNPNIGFSLPNILSGGSSTISFKVNVTNMPSPPQIDNFATSTYKYKISPTGLTYNGSETSNTVTTYINEVTVTNTKSVDKLFAEVNNELIYTSIIKNTGNVDITNTNFVDILSPEATFVQGSVTINGESFIDYNPTTGFTLGTISSNETYTVVFKVIVSSLPSTGHLHNKSTVYYKYKINPSGPDILANKDSNTVTTSVKSGNLTIIKKSDRSYSRLTDIITYSFIVTNTGNTELSSLFFQDTLQADTSFNPGTVYIDGTNIESFDPTIGFNLNNLAVGSETTITFSITVNTLPSDGKLYNTGNIDYSYYVDPKENPITKNKTSNTTMVNINNAVLSSTKTVDKSIAEIGDLLTYTISLYNGGTVDATSINFTDLLDANISFNTGTVKINDELKPNLNPNEGFIIDSISPNSTTTIEFTATVISKPIENIVPNFATIDYQYKVNPEEPYIDIYIETNIVSTYIAVGTLSLTKFVDKTYSTVDEILNYTVEIKNTGSVDATNLTFTDLNPNNTEFVPNSVVIDGVLKGDLDPNLGFSLEDLMPNHYHTVSFEVLINSLPSSGQVDNTASTSFDYKLTPSDPTESTTMSSNEVTTYVNLGKLDITKSVDKIYATIGDTLSYTINIENIGNVTCSNIFFQDIIQSNASFVADSLKIDDISKPGLNPNVGFNLNDIIKDGITKITFDVTVNTLPIDYYIKNKGTANYEYKINPNNEPTTTTSTSNTVSTNIKLGKLTVTKETNKAYATINDIVSYTVTITNTGNTDASFINFRDIIPNGLTFVTDSVKINGILKPGFNPYQSFTLGNMLPGESSIVKFDTKVTSVPSPSLVTNIANIVFSYKIDPNVDYIVKETNSNSVTTQINLGKLTIIKNVDKAYATIDDILTYTIEVTNTGNVNATNVNFIDGIQLESSFVLGSVTINNVDQPTYNPEVGFNLGTIAPLEKITITFKATVDSLPSEYTIINTSTSTFSYKVNPQGETYTKTAQSNSVSTIVVFASLKSTKTVNASYATIGDILEYIITVKNTGNTQVNSLFFMDTLSSGATFENGSTVIDGISYSSLNPLDGFNLNNLAAGHTTVISFKAKVNSVPTPSQITNFAVTNGSYKIDPQGLDYDVSNTSNTVSTQVNLGNLTNTKVVDKMYAKLNDNLTYTNTITNVGNVNALNTWFSDTLQSDIVFVNGTVRINNIVYPSLDPIAGFSLGDLTPGQIVTVSFDVKVKTLPLQAKVLNKSQCQFSYKINPSGNLITKTTISNEVATNIVKGNLAITKTVDRIIATIGDLLVFNITVTNSGNVIANDVFFQDTPSVGAIFKEGTVVVNGISEITFDPTVGFSLGNIGIGNVATIQFIAEVTTVPATNKVTNQAISNFKFVVDPKDPPFTTTAYSNITTTNISIGSLSVIKAVNKDFATKGDNLTYTIVITNTGNIDTSNVEFLDPTPENSIFVTDSVAINGITKPGLNPAIGFSLGTMKPSEIITVIYQVTVI